MRLGNIVRALLLTAALVPLVGTKTHAWGDIWGYPTYLGGGWVSINLGAVLPPGTTGGSVAIWGDGSYSDSFSGSTYSDTVYINTYCTPNVYTILSFEYWLFNGDTSEATYSGGGLSFTC